MKANEFLSAFLLLAVCGAAHPGRAEPGPHAVIKEVPISRVKVADGFFGPRRDALVEVTLPSQWEQFERHHHLHNFRVMAGEEEGVHLGAVFLDSDLYKWLEAASYMAGERPDNEWLSERVEELSGLITRAQAEDGYINTYYQGFAPDRRFTNLWMNHELYCAGHFMEAACARCESMGEYDLLEAAQSFAELIERGFGPGANQGVPGHEEIELALVRLYRVTGDRRHLEQARFFVERRGRQEKYVRSLLADLGDQARLSRTARKEREPWLDEKDREAPAMYGFADIPPSIIPRALASFYSGRYFQVHRPLVEQEAAEGHAVRAMYFYAGAADLYLETGDSRSLSALERIWDNTIEKRTYLTGGVGSLPVIEGFGRDYELPRKSYSETCAAIGSFFFSWRMLRGTGEAAYADQMERTLYNAIIPALSLDGRHYFYRNPLTAKGEVVRKEWYTVACCPPNMARLLASLGRYLYGECGDGVWVHQYVTGEARLETGKGRVRLEVESGLPWSGGVKIEVGLKQTEMPFALRLRIPGWAEKAEARLNGRPLSGVSPGTYLAIERTWKEGDLVELELGVSPRFIDPRPEVRAQRGRAALMCGPLVYCLEDRDNPGVDVHKVRLDKSAALESHDRPGLLGGVVTVKARSRDGRELVFIPYYAWANRGPSHMELWVRAD